MKTLVIYDSFFGNTEKIASAIASAIAAITQESVDALRVGEVKPEQLKGVDLLIVGSPTRAFRPTDAIRKFLNGLPAGALKGVKTASFDTRISVEQTKSGFLRVMVQVFGYAAKPIGDLLEKKGGRLVQPPEGFYVMDSEGPLKDGELERAARWADLVL